MIKESLKLANQPWAPDGASFAWLRDTRAFLLINFDNLISNFFVQVYYK